MGFSHLKILKSRYIVLAIETIVSAALTAINYYFACFLQSCCWTFCFVNCYTGLISKGLYMKSKRGHNYVIDRVENIKRNMEKNKFYLMICL